MGSAASSGAVSAGAGVAAEPELVALLAGPVFAAALLPVWGAVPAGDVLGDGVPPFAGAGFFAPLCVAGAAALPGVAPATWVCEVVTPALAGVVFAGAEVIDGEFVGTGLIGAGFVSAFGAGVDIEASAAAVVASRSAAKG